LALQCQRWGALPEPGGIYDQPAKLLEKMAILLNVFEATRAYMSAADPTVWASRQPAAWELYAWAKKLERQYG
jgi:hypothetical protein